ncbi:MAG: SpoIIE family protein phosphatase [Cyanophyceae cyanobacterium]
MLKKNPPQFSLPTALVAFFVVQIVAAVGLVGYISFRGSQRAVNDISSQLRRELTVRIERELQGYFETTHELNLINAYSLAQGQIDLANGENAAQFLQQLKISPFVDAIYCGDENGNFFGVSRTSANDAASEFNMLVANAQTIGTMHAYGITFQGSRRFFLESYGEFDPRSRPWYRAAFRTQRPSWSDIYLDFTTRFPTITSSRPVYNETGRKVVGVCGTDVLLPEDFRKFLSDLSIGKTGQAFVIDRTGQVISSSTDEPLTVGVGEETELVRASESSKPLIQESAQFLLQRFGSYQAIHTSQQLEFSWEGQRQLMQVLPFQDGRGLDWLIVVTVPEADFMEQIYSTTRNTVWLTLAALAVAIALGILAARWITRPVLKITEASRKMAAGNLAQRVDEASRIVEMSQLARSFNSMAGQLEAFFNTLENKVKERTADLAQANEQITTLNTKLKAENRRLGAEVDVARRMQQMILPTSEELSAIQGLNIAGYMEPADEVGGDYYDVLYTDGVVTIGIGDVTGHGLESGILMVMTQTAVRTLKEIRETDPVRFLDALNRTIYQNVQRMNTDRNLTLAVLNYADGKISLSGQHEEAIVVRADGSVERVDTIDLGFPIGLDDNIADFISHTLVEMNSGDGLILYTDGITEAKDINRVQYGIERLGAVASQSWQGSAEDVKQAVIEDLRRHIGQQKVFDDITLVVLKQR